MMNITIYLGPRTGSSVDASHIEKGNPGVGGTPFCMLELAVYLHDTRRYNVTILAVREYRLKQGIRFFQIERDSDICNVVEELKTDILILSQFNNRNLEVKIAKLKCKVVIWSHNYIFSHFCNFITNTPQIVCNVFVGKQLYDRYIDDDVIKKSTFIYNMYSDKFPDIKREDDHKTVVYMGALIPGKGFLELCSIWKKVLNRIPEAKLLVMGSGKLYGEAELGKLGIASTKYEQLLEKYILDTQGNIIPSVRFLGVVGEGKEEIFRKASVGIVNPSGRTETFGMGVVEMGEARLPVVTIGKNGYFDTVQSGKSGILSKSLDTMADDIVKLLTDHSLNKKMGDEAKRNNQRFLPSVIGPQWDVLLEDIYSDTLKFEILKPSRPYSNNFKWIRICISKIRFGLGIRYIPSMIKIESYLVKLLYK